MSETVVFVGILTELIDKLLVINNSNSENVNETINASQSKKKKKTPSEACEMASLSLQAKCYCRNP